MSEECGRVNLPTHRGSFSSSIDSYPLLLGQDQSMASTSTPEPGPSKTKKPPMVIITLGLAGSGKTTFIQRLNSYLHSENQPPYIVNLDPAVSHLPFDANIDIRDTVNYEEVMKQSVAHRAARCFLAQRVSCSSYYHAYLEKDTTWVLMEGL